MVVKIVQGDALSILKTLKSDCINTCITSPPYFGLRDYGVAGQIGLEPSPDLYVQNMVDIFREVRRCLRPDGTLWLNLGDSYAGSGRGGNPDAGTKQGTNKGSQSIGVLYGREHESALIERRRVKQQFAALSQLAIKPKDLVGIPWRVAFALQADGWYLRQDIIWAKPNPMPESVRDRCTKSHEYLFLLSKEPKYYFDADAIAEDAVSVERKKWTDHGSEKQRGHGRRHAGFNGRYAERIMKEGAPKKRNRRSVWFIAPQPFKEAHFATFPPDLVEPCALAGCPIGGYILDPFAGSGTVGMVANKLNRHAILFELNPEYVEMVKRRCNV